MPNMNLGKRSRGPSSTAAAEPAPKRRITDTFTACKPISPAARAGRDKCSGIEVFDDGSNGKENVPATPMHRRTINIWTPLQTPKHRGIAAAKPVTPKTPVTPRSSRFAEARQALSCGQQPGRLTERDAERQEIVAFLDKAHTTRSGALYVSGPPGTGKSAVLKDTMQTYQKHGAFSFAYVNCMTVKSAKNLEELIRSDLPKFPWSIDGSSQLIATPALKPISLCVLVLDEVDHLLDIDSELLSSLFKTALTTGASFAVIGIANALDLTDRFLPHLRALNIKPILVPFLPYTASQIHGILTSRLRSLLPEAAGEAKTELPFVQPAALQLCAKKIASRSGDLREAFDMCRRAIDLFEREMRAKDLEDRTPESPSSSPSKTPLGVNINMSTPPKSPTPVKRINGDMMKAFVSPAPPRVGIAHMVRIAASVSTDTITSRLRELNLHQKIALCVLHVLDQRHVSKNTLLHHFSSPSKSFRPTLSLKEIYTRYVQVCKDHAAWHAVCLSEFSNVMDGLEAQSLVSLSTDRNMGKRSNPSTPSKRGPRSRASMALGSSVERVYSLCVSVKELQAVLEGAAKEILERILKIVQE